MPSVLFRLLWLLRLALPAGEDPLSQPPPLPREFRAAWVATLDNIDWPSRRTLSPAEQHAEIRRILDAAVDLKLNAVILQVRAAADAIYPSQLEPWSISLSGTQGQSPGVAWDPLLTWIDEAHQRGLELHAWLNPCRAHVGMSRTAATHVSKTHPELVVHYDRSIWFDPGLPAAVQQILAVFEDVTRRYDIDGIHVDDYFYPYPVERSGRRLPFPDDSSWKLYQISGGPLARDDWRRENVNSLVRRIHEQTVRLRPGIRFGISPFGISRPGVAPGITGFDQFTGIFADPVLWLRNGWCDYLAPQLYWPVNQRPQSFPILLQSWKQQNPLKIPVWPGLFTSRPAASSGVWPADEIPRQIEICRTQTQSAGHIHFSFNALLQDRDGIAGRLKKTVYRSPAVVPIVRRPPLSPPAAPVLTRHAAEFSITLRSPKSGNAADSSHPRSITVWSLVGQTWKLQIHPASRTSIAVPPDARRLAIAVVDRWGQQGASTFLQMSPAAPATSGQPGD